MIDAHCACGEVYHAEDDKAGYSIICTKCKRVIDLDISGKRSIYVLKPKRKPQAIVIGLLALAITAFVGYNLPRTHYTPIRPVPDGLPSNGKSSAPQTSVLFHDVPHTNLSLPTGTNITNPLGLSGRSTLTVINGNDKDAVVKLVGNSDLLSPQAAYRCIYVKSGERFTIKSIPAGSYSVLYELGKGWGNQLGFASDEENYRFGVPLVFGETTSDIEDGSKKTEWSVFTITLHSVLTGNVKAQTISKEDFDQPK